MSVGSYTAIFDPVCKEIKNHSKGKGYPVPKVYTGAISMGPEGDLETLDSNTCADALGYHPYTSNLAGTGLLGRLGNTKVSHPLALEWGCVYWGSACAVDMNSSTNFFANALKDIAAYRSASGKPIIEADYFLLNQAPIGRNAQHVQENAPVSVSLFQVYNSALGLGRLAGPRVNSNVYTYFKTAMNTCWSAVAPRHHRRRRTRARSREPFCRARHS